LLRRGASGLVLLVAASAVLAAVGAVGHALGWVLLTTALGPTAYVLLTHPGTVPAQVRDACVGHLCATAVGLALLAAFGLWSSPSVAQRQHDSWRQIGAGALSVGLTLLVLELLGTHHPPAATTALLITSGIARPGPPLYGLLTGLALLLVSTPFPARARAALAARRAGPPSASG
jgi:hypothetical protein